MRWEKAQKGAWSAEEAALLAEYGPSIRRAVTGQYRLSLQRSDGTWFLAVGTKGRELRAVEFNSKEKAE